MEADENTFRRLEGWYKRVTSSRELLYEGLYGRPLPSIGIPRRFRLVR